MKGILKSHKRRESKKQGAGLIRPTTIKAAFLVLRLIDLVVKIINKLFS